MNITRKIATYGAGVAVVSSGLLGLGSAAAPMAHADSPDTTAVSCSTASSTATITPGITTSAPTSKIAVKAPFKASGCSGAAASVSGTIKLSSTTLTCISGSATGTFTSTSSAGSSSGNMTLKATSTPLKFTLTGKVTKGYESGSAISGTFTATPVTGNCTTSSPLTKATIKNDGAFKL
jgi:hypothetical protein